MENAIPMHVLDGLEQFVHVVLDALLGHVVAATFDSVVEVHVHELEDESEATSRLVEEHLE